LNKNKIFKKGTSFVPKKDIYAIIKSLKLPWESLKTR